MKLLKPERSREGASHSSKPSLAGMAGVMLELVEVSLKKSTVEKAMHRFQHGAYVSKCKYASLIPQNYRAVKIRNQNSNIFCYWAASMFGLYDMYLNKQNVDSKKDLALIENLEELMTQLHHCKQFWPLAQLIGMLKCSKTSSAI